MLRVRGGGRVSSGGADPSPGLTFRLADESHAEALSVPRLRERMLAALGSSASAVAAGEADPAGDRSAVRHGEHRLERLT
jgi:hypothetical protein